ncbi:BRCA1 BRCA2-containing complex, subunit 3 [Sparganum proliferum]
MFISDSSTVVSDDVPYDRRLGLVYCRPDLTMVRSIIVSPEAYQTMLLHAFTHEREEIGGVLVGENGGPETSVITVIPLQRTSEQSDRVEISGAELAGCIDKCEDSSRGLETETVTAAAAVAAAAATAASTP